VGLKLRDWLKRSTERFAATTGIAQFLARRPPRCGAILAYHNVVPDSGIGKGDQSLHMPVSRFKSHLDLIQRHGSVVPLLKLLERPTTPEVLEVAITFDDAYRGAIDLGIRELITRGLPATVFVPPGFLEGKDFWWDALADERHGGLEPEVRRFALSQLAGDDVRIRKWALANGLKLHPVTDVMQCCTQNELMQTRVAGNVTIASHSWAHRNLGSLALWEMERDLSDAAEWVRSVNGDTAVLAYPYGIQPTDCTRVVSHGHRFGLLVEGGRLPRKLDQLAVPRINVPSGLSAEGLLLRLAGVRA